MLPTLRPSEQSVARYVLEHADEVTHMRIVDLAQEAKVSEPTVVRFCRNVGCSGFQAFKLELAQQLGAGLGRTLELQSTDSIEAVSQKTFDAALLTLREISANLPGSTLTEACRLIDNARHIECIGYGGSHPIAIDAQTKLFRLGIKTSCNADIHIQRMSVMTMTSRDVVLAISQSGRSKDLLNVLEQARYEGAQIIGIGPGSSPMEKLCSVFLAAGDGDANEMHQAASPLPTRLGHMLIVDVLVASLVLQLGNIGRSHIDNMNQALNQLRLPKPGAPKTSDDL